MLWAGDFNRHHLLWDRDEDTHLFTGRAEQAAEKLINLLAEYDMAMPLPKGIPTLQHMHSKRFSRQDDVFCTQGILGHITQCKVVAALQPTCTDHFLIVTQMTLPQNCMNPEPRRNFRETDWNIFRKKLAHNLNSCPDATPITALEQLNTATVTIQKSNQTGD